jgi:phage repressor protein C with HTH and peptisase S24 domain
MSARVMPAMSSRALIRDCSLTSGSTLSLVAGIVCSGFLKGRCEDLLFSVVKFCERGEYIYVWGSPNPFRKFIMGRPRKIAPGLGERILSLVRSDQTNAEFADEIGIADATLGNYLRGEREPSYDFLRRLRAVRGVDINWLITGEGKSDVKPASRHKASNQVAIPRYAIHASAGGGAVVLSEEVEDYFTVSPDWLGRYLPKGGKVGIIEARGDSMEPTIADGDILILNFSIDSSAVNDGGVFVISVDGVLLVKRLQATVDGHILIRSDNDLYEQEKVTREFADERITVHAKVVWSGGPIRRR